MPDRGRRKGAGRTPAPNPAGFVIHDGRPAYRYTKRPFCPHCRAALSGERCAGCGRRLRFKVTPNARYVIG